ncbi:MAG: hypothetical protein WD894_01370 [Pirellulales bacterium]
MKRTPHHSFCFLIVPLAGILASLTRPAFTQDDRSEKAAFKRWLDYYQNVAAAYDIRLESDKQTKLEVTREPVMSYSHASERVHGAFFLWTHKGRPELVGSIWSDDVGGGRRNVVHEFHSLALGRLVPVRVGGRTWRPAPGLELKPIPNSQKPKDSRPLRLAQMRLLAREFTGFSTPHGRELRLRTPPQPLYRYASGEANLIDGAIFCMFADWDPDLILLIEARGGKDGSQWFYGIARFNATPVRLEHNGTTVWESGLVPMSDPTSPFYAAVVESTRLSEM